jgi:hypothetical protein
MSGWGDEAWGQSPWGGGSPVSVGAVDVSYFVVNYAPSLPTLVDHRASVGLKGDLRTSVPLPARHDMSVSVVASSVPVLTRAATYSTSISKAGSP